MARTNHLSRILLTAFEAVVLISLIACGVQEPRYTPYKTNPNGTGDPADPSSEDATENGTESEEEVDCVDTAIAVFQLQIAGAVNGSCTNCHSSNNSLILISNQTENNRAALLAYTGTDPDILIDKIHQNNGETHGGGDQAGTLGETPIREWLTAEAACE